MRAGQVLLQKGGDLPDLSGERAGWLLFEEPVEVVRADRPADVQPALERVRNLTLKGRFAAGFLAYEAAPGLDPAMRVHREGRGPLAWFGIYERAKPLDSLPQAPSAGPPGLGPWRPALPREAYEARIETIQDLIAAGDTYQVNFTYPLNGSFEGDPWGLFRELQRPRRARYAAYLEVDDLSIVSLSPELFFAQAGDRVVTRPMKGTAARGRWLEEDEARAAELAASSKDRAENVMIVDLLRNDLGRIAHPGGVGVRSLYDVEHYETVLQMTSTIEARTDAHPVDVLAALFPCGSVTGAPKIRTMEIIADREVAPRGIYTGTIGWIGPGRRAQMNVAIRTIQLRAGAPEGCARATFGVGGGVTWSSTPQGEHEETLTKARLVLEPRPIFALLESIRWTPDDGYYLLDRHVARLIASARYFQYPVDEQTVRRKLDELAGRLNQDREACKVRLLADEHGRLRLEADPLDLPTPGASMKVAFAAQPVDSRDVFLFHKTTHREVYDRALRSRPEAEEVVLYNERGEVTEAATANILVELEGRLWTPPRACGLLAGTLREELLAEGKVAERVIDKDELARAEGFWLINSVRGKREARLFEWVEDSDGRMLDEEREARVRARIRS